MSETSTKTVVCTDCDTSFEGTGRAKRCEPCRAECKRVKQRERMQAWRAAQPKTESIDVKCRDCDAMITRGTGPGQHKKILCESCVRAAQLDNYNRYKRGIRDAAKAERPPRLCQDCDVDISALHGQTIRCEPCRLEKTREYHRQLRAAHPKPPVLFYCIVCNAAIDRVGNSGRPIYCAEHALAAKRASTCRIGRKRTPTRTAKLYTHCHYCKGELPEPRQSVRTPARCEPCKRQWHYEYMRNRTTQRMAAAMCGDCGKPANPKRKGPRTRCFDCQLARRRARYRQYAHGRRALMNGVGSEDFLSTEIYERDGWRCGLCRRKIRRELEHPHPLSASLDHVIPLVHDGPHSRANTQAAHLRCNVIKKDKIENVQMALFG
jgi:hypothetical protein